MHYAFSKNNENLMLCVISYKVKQYSDKAIPDCIIQFFDKAISDCMVCVSIMSNEAHICIV